jgi:hypothetical protein
MGRISRWRRMRPVVLLGTLRAALALTAVLGLALPARADDGCAAIGWSVKNEQHWFADNKMPARVSGARLRRIDRAVTLGLMPLKQIHFFLPPVKASKAGSYAGEVTFFGVPRPGVYQVTLSAPADVDVFENGVRIKPIVLASAPKCDDARVSGRYALGAGNLVLVQISNAVSNAIKVAFELAP